MHARPCARTSTPRWPTATTATTAARTAGPRAAACSAGCSRGHATDAERRRASTRPWSTRTCSPRTGEALAAVAASADATELDRATLEQWLVGPQRGAPGARHPLDVAEDCPADLDPDDPELPVWAVYEFLGSVLDAAVRALSRSM